jgi:hypothetical protein
MDHLDFVECFLDIRHQFGWFNNLYIVSVPQKISDELISGGIGKIKDVPIIFARDDG